MGGKFHLKLNTCERPIANKYREGKMKRTLKRELKVLEIAKNEGMETSTFVVIFTGVIYVTPGPVATKFSQGGLCSSEKGVRGRLVLIVRSSIRWVRPR